MLSQFITSINYVKLIEQQANQCVTRIEKGQKMGSNYPGMKNGKTFTKKKGKRNN